MVDEELVDQYSLSLVEPTEFFYEEAPNLMYQMFVGPWNPHGQPTAF